MRNERVMNDLAEAEARESELLAQVNGAYNAIMSRYRDLDLDFGIEEKVLSEQLHATREAVAALEKEADRTVRVIETAHEVHAVQKAKTEKEVREAERKEAEKFNAMERARKELAWFKKNHGLLPLD